MPDHVRMLVSIPPRLSESSFMGYLKGKSVLMMFDKHANLKYKFDNRHFLVESFNNLGIVEECKLDLMKPQLRNIFKSRKSMI